MAQPNSILFKETSNTKSNRCAGLSVTASLNTDTPGNYGYLTVMSQTQ